MIEYIVKFNGPCRPEDSPAQGYDSEYVYFAEGVTWHNNPEIPSLYQLEERATRYPTPEAAFAAALPYLGMGGGYVVLPVKTPDPLPEPIEAPAVWNSASKNLYLRAKPYAGSAEIEYWVRIEFLERLS